MNVALHWPPYQSLSQCTAPTTPRSSFAAPTIDLSPFEAETANRPPLTTSISLLSMSAAMITYSFQILQSVRGRFVKVLLRLEAEETGKTATDRHLLAIGNYP